MTLGSFRWMQWCFPVAVALHNSEEAIFMPRWVNVHSSQMPVHPSTGFIWAGLLVTVLAAFLVTALSSAKGRQSIWAYLLFGAVAMMLINVFVPHIPATLIYRQYTPGVVTAVLINLPVMIVLILRAVRDGWVSGWRAVRYAFLVPLMIGGLIEGVFRLG